MKKRFSAVVIGGSAGALDVLLKALPQLPADYPLPIIIVLHLKSKAKSVLAELFTARVDLKVAECEDKMPISPGSIYFAPPDYHLLVDPNGTFALDTDQPIQFSRPSIDAFFESAAFAYGEALLAVLLSGANQDGAQGLEAIHKAGGEVFVQNPTSAQAAMMPQAAIKRVTASKVIEPDALAALLLDIPRRKV